MRRRSPIVGVMGPGEQATDLDCQQAFELGRHIAQAGWIVLTGGRNSGVMDAVSRGAKSADGLTVGILPSSDYQALSAAIDIPIVTGMGSGRNVINVLSSGVIVACGMGSGTASEVALALKVGKPVILLNPHSASQQFFCQLAPRLVRTVVTVEEAIEQIRVCLS